eukprot:gene22245-26829_t
MRWYFSAFLFPALALGEWTTHTISQDGAVRTYMKYVPASTNTYSGLMMFIHGVAMSDDVRFDYEVETNAEEFGFVGVVPTGTPVSSGQGGFGWNIEDESGPEDVRFLQSVVEQVSTENSIATDAHKIALGFSNGAGLAALLGCHNSENLYVAHVGVHIDPNADDFPSTCITGGGSGGKDRSGDTGAGEGVSEDDADDGSGDKDGGELGKEDGADWGNWTDDKDGGNWTGDKDGWSGDKDGWSGDKGRRLILSSGSTSSQPTWNAVGVDDFFITGLQPSPEE